MTGGSSSQFSQFRIRSLFIGTTIVAAGLSLSGLTIVNELLLIGIPLCLFLPLASWALATVCRTRHPTLPGRLYTIVAWITLGVASASCRYIMREPFISMMIVLNFWLPQVAWVFGFEWCERERR